MLKQISNYGLKSRIKVTGFTDIETFKQYVLACDINISLRYPTMGETSGVLMRCLAAGKPSIVSDIGTFMELDDDIVKKISVGQHEETELFDAMYELATNQERREFLSQNAKKYAEQNLKISSTADSFIEFICEMAQVKKMRDSSIYQSVMKNLTKSIKEINFHIDEKRSERLSRYLEGLF